MRILILTPRLPWPPIDGGRIAMGRLAEGLAAAGATVEIVSLNPRKHRADAAESPVPLQTVDIDTSRVVAPLFGAISGNVPFIAGRFVSRQFQAAIRTALRRFKPDIVQIESPFLMPYAAAVREESGARIALRSLNVEFRIWEGLARNERNPLRRLALRRVAKSLRAYEIRNLDTPDALIPISTADAADFRNLGCSLPMHVVPCGITLSDVGNDPLESGTVGFIGSLDFRPNQEAVQWIVDELWPRVRERAPGARLSVAGSGAPEWLREKAQGKNIEFLGRVNDAAAFLQRMSIIIAPLFAGGGMRIKVLEAMALAKPVVATTLGAGGIEVAPGRNIVIADDLGRFAEEVARLLHDPGMAARIGSAARDTVRECYDSGMLAKRLLGFYESL